MTEIRVFIDANDARHGPAVLAVPNHKITVNVVNFPPDLSGELEIVKQRLICLSRDIQEYRARKCAGSELVRELLAELRPLYGQEKGLNKIDFIKIVRVLTAMSLKEAKEFVDRNL